MNAGQLTHALLGYELLGQSLIFRFFMEIFHRSKEKSHSKDSERGNSSAWLLPMSPPEDLIFLTLILLSNSALLRMLIHISIDQGEQPELEEMEHASHSSQGDSKAS